MQDQVLTRWPKGRPGTPHAMLPKRDETYTNSEEAVAEVRKIVVDTAADNTAYAWTLMGEAQTITSALSGATKVSIGKQIRAKMKNSPLTGAYLQVVFDGTDTVTCTSRRKNEAFTLTDSDSNLTSSLVTAAAAGTPVPFGSLLVYNGAAGFGQATRSKLASLTAKVMSMTPVHVNSATYWVAFKTKHMDAWIVRHYLADSSATVDEIVDNLVTLLNTAAPANSVLFAADASTATKLLATSEIAGLDFDMIAWSDLDTALCTVAREDTGGDAAIIDKAFLGGALEDQTVPVDTASQLAAQYPAGVPMDVRLDGAFNVKLEDGSAPGVFDNVWIGVGSGHEGLCRKTASGANYLKLDRSRARFRAALGLIGDVYVAGIEVSAA